MPTVKSHLIFVMKWYMRKYILIIKRHFTTLSPTWKRPVSLNFELFSLLKYNKPNQIKIKCYFFMECDWSGCAYDVFLFLLVFGAFMSVSCDNCLYKIMIDPIFCVGKCLSNVSFLLVSTDFWLSPGNKQICIILILIVCWF